MVGITIYFYSVVMYFVMYFVFFVIRRCCEVA